MVCLDMYPDAPTLAFLVRDLARVGKQRPVILFFHYSLEGPYSDFWEPEEKAAFGKALEGYNVLAIFHGHEHRMGHYSWRGHPVFRPGSPRHRSHHFLAVRVDGASDGGGGPELRRSQVGGGLAGAGAALTASALLELAPGRVFISFSTPLVSPLEPAPSPPQSGSGYSPAATRARSDSETAFASARCVIPNHGLGVSRTRTRAVPAPMSCPTASGR